MKVKKKFLFLNLLFILTMMLFSGTSYAGNQSWNSLDFDVIVHEDGSMDVIETWDVNISYTNTMFKDFKLKYGEKYAFTNPKVTEVKDGVEYPLEQIYEEQYHVDPGCFYGMKVASGPYEIAWNVGLDGSSAKKIYKIYYTVTDAVKVYNDCTELYWQFLGDENTMTGKNVTGIIKIPAGITDIEKLRVWGHGNLRGDIQKIDNNTIKFTMPDVASNEMLEVRIVTDDNIYTSCTNKISKNYFDTVMEEEGKWAKEANRKRMIAKSAKYCVLAIPFLIIVIFLFSIIKLIKKGKELDEKKLTEIDLEYYREIPNEKEASPGRALYLCGFKTADSKLFSATIMDLIVKGYLTVEGTDKSDFALRLNDAPVGLLPNEELIIFNKIKDFTIDKVVKIKDLKKGLKKEPDILYYALRSVENAVDTYENTVNNYSKEKEKEQQKLRSKVSTYTGLLFVGAMLIFFAIILFNYNISLIWKLVPAIIAIEIFICLILSMRNYKKIDPLTEKGNEERAKWKGLKKYMEDFSLLNEKDIPDYVLWEKFLVYATAFGISKKVLEQLKIVCPKMLEENLNNNMYIFTNDYFLRDFNDIYHDSYVARERQQAAERRRQAVRDFWSAASSDSNWSSGSGGGGGFSGGGGGRRWRPEAAEDVN